MRLKKFSKKITISNKEPILIENEDKESKVWIWIKRMGGLAGIVLTFTLLIKPIIERPKISSKIIGLAYQSGIYQFRSTMEKSKVDTFSAIKYFLQFSINVTTQNLNYNNVFIHVKYENDDSIYDGINYYPGRHYKEWTLDKKNKLLLEIPQDELLYYKTNLEKNRTHLVCLTFFVLDTIHIGIPEFFQLDFISSKKRLLGLKHKIYSSPKMFIDQENEMTFIVDDRLWKEPGVQGDFNVLDSVKY